MSGAKSARLSKEASDDPTPTDVQLAAARFRGLSAETRGCAVLGPQGKLLASTGDAAGWREPALALLEAADSAAGEAMSHAHVATEDGEVYVVREAGLAMVAVTERFTLSSLTISDMRSSLRELRRAAAAQAESRAA